MVGHKRIVPFALIASLVGCALEAPSGPELLDLTEPPIHTDQTTYVLETNASGWEGVIQIEYVNASARKMYLGNCHGAYSYFLEKREGEEWVPAWSPILPMCKSPDIEIPAGEVFSDAVWVHGARPGTNVEPKFDVDEIDGTYRLVIFANWADEAPPLEYRVSNTFEIRTEQP